jgi:dihydroflavonol-4-reductase
VAGARLLAGDIADRAGVARAVASSNARFVFHLAGRVRAPDLGAFMQVNAGGVESILRACADQPDPPVLVLVSSLAAAGPSRDVPTVESDPPAPVSHYGRSKLAGEQAATRDAVALPITVVRPCIVFGAGDRGMVEVFRPIARSGLYVVGGSGERRVSLVAAADLAACLVLAAEKGERLAPGVPGQGVYFSAADDLSYVELGVAIARALGRPQPRTLCLPGWSARTIGRIGDVASRIRGRPWWIGEGPAAAGLAACGPACGPAPRSGAVVPRRVLALIELRARRSRRIGAKDKSADCRGLLPGHHSARS